MKIRSLIWIGTAIDAVLLLPALYMAIGAVDLAGDNIRHLLERALP